MRTLRLALALVSPAVTGGARLAAQAVERTDLPARGVLRVTCGARPAPRRGRSHRSPLRESHGPDGPRANPGLAAAFEQRCQPRREPAGGEHAGGTRDGLGVLRAIRLRAGATRPAGGGMYAAPI